MRRASIGSGVAWAVYSRLSSELYAVCSLAIGISMQPHPHQGYTAVWWLMADGCPHGRNASQGESTAYEAS